MKYLQKDALTISIVKNSRFLAYLFSVTTKEEVEQILINLRKQHPKADHFCYGYLLDNNSMQKYSDDGEPARTAGFPIIDVLLKNELDDCLAVVVRFYGGIKLGAAGLTRAYRSAVAETIKECTFVEKTSVPLYRVKVDYSISKAVANFLKANGVVTNSKFHSQAEYTFYLNDQNSFKDLLELTGGTKPELVSSIKTKKEIE